MGDDSSPLMMDWMTIHLGDGLDDFLPMVMG
jgi:hypothetical protein